MTTRHMLRCTAAAAATALAGFGAQAMEATMWNPQEDAAAVATADATLAPMAWALDRGDATQFRDGTARDSVTARAAVRADLKQARAKHLMNDTGEGGATDRVLASREAFIGEEHDRIVAMSEPDDTDRIGEMIAAMAPTADYSDELDTWDTATMSALAPYDMTLRLPSNQDPSVPLPSEHESLAMAINPTPWLDYDPVVADAATAVSLLANAS